MKVVHVVPYLRLESAGPSYSVPALCKGLLDAGCDVSLCTSGGLPKKEYGFPLKDFAETFLPHPKFCRSPGLLRYLIDECKDVDIVCSNSAWTYVNVYPAWAKKRATFKLVSAPRGTMSEWAWNFHWPQKRLFGFYAQYAAFRATDMWHATVEAEYDDIRRRGYRQPVMILPNGVNLPHDIVAGTLARNRRRMLYLSRIHPTKNVDILLRCWSRLEAEFPDWDLSIVGPDKDNPYADEMKHLARCLGCKRVTFEGEVRGAAKYTFMADSECEVLPTNTENFGMVVAEALACGTPVICSQGAPWQGLQTNRCGWWTPIDESAFETAMREAMTMSRDELGAMGARGREWMRRDFDWDSIGEKTKIAYEWLCGKTDRPEWVAID